MFEWLFGRSGTGAATGVEYVRDGADRWLDRDTFARAYLASRRMPVSGFNLQKLERAMAGYPDGPRPARAALEAWLDGRYGLR